MKRIQPLLFLVVFAIGAFAQGPQTGFPPYGSFEHGQFDSVNRQNLNVNFVIPILSSPGRGVNFTFAIIYDSLIWNWAVSGSTKYWTPTGAWGWKTDSPTGRISWSKTTQVIKCFDEFGGWYWAQITKWSGYVYRDPAGTSHTFGVAITDGCDSLTSTGKGYATDKSGYYLDATVPESPVVMSTAGIKIASDGSLTDTNGNFISKVVVSSTETHWKDTVGRIALKIIKPSPTIIQYHVLDPLGAYQITTLTLEARDIRTSFACAGVVEYTSTTSVMLPTKLDLPNGRSYTFEYEPTPDPNFPNHTTGRLKKVILPTGGFYQYDYPGSNGGINCADGTILSLNRTINDGTSSSVWGFSRVLGTTGWQTSVVAPPLPYDTAANSSLFIFDNDGKSVDQYIYQGSSTTALGRIVTTWATNGTPASNTVILENGQQSKTETVFDDFRNLLEFREYDWGSSAPGPLIGTTTMTYLSSAAYTDRNIRNRLTQQIAKDGFGAIKSRTDISYDEPAYLNTECPLGIAQHNDSAYGCTFYTRGNATTVTSYSAPATPSGAITKHFFYDFFGNLRKADVDCCQQKQWNFSSITQHAYPDSVVDGPAGGPQLTTSFTYNFHTGLLASSTDPNNKTTSFSYDTLKRPTVVTRPDAAQITTSYDDTNRIITIENPIQGTDRARQRTEYDSLGRAFRQCLLDGSGAVVSCRDTQYDPLSRPYRVSNPHNSTAQHWTETRFDGLGRPTLVIPPDGSQTSNRTIYSYSGNTVTVTDPTGKQRKTETDALGRLVKVYEPDVTNGNQLTQITSYSHNVLDLLTQVTQGVQSRTYNYDGLGRLTSPTTPEANTVSYQYNNFNLVTQRTDARGVQTNYQYDVINRLVGVSYTVPAGSNIAPMPNVCTSAIGQPANVCFSYGTDPNLNNKGRLLSMTDATGSESYEYHSSMPWITKVTKGIDGTSYVIQYGYNLGGELTSIIYPSGRVVDQSYDVAGRLSRIFSGATTTYASQFTYNAAGQATGFTYGNGVVASFVYSPERLQLTSLNYTKETQTLFSLSYGYAQNGGNNGQITSITDGVDAGRSASYIYDALGRLKEAATVGSATYPKWHYIYKYDRYGNLTDKELQPDSVGAHPQLSVTVDASTNRITSSGFSYNEGGSSARGNLTQDFLNGYTYDAENRITQVNGGGTATYSYDGAGLRVKKTASGSTIIYIFSGSKVVAEYVAGAPVNSPAREYIYFGSQLLATIVGSTVTYHHSDHLSVRASTDPLGQILRDAQGNNIGEQGHYPFGDQWYKGSGGTKWQFTSYERDGESGLDYAMFRYDSSRLGRFQTPDPIAGSVADPQSLNRYAYVANDPINRVDPDGQRASLIMEAPVYTAGQLYAWRYGFVGAGVMLPLGWGWPLGPFGTPPTFPTYDPFAAPWICSFMPWLPGCYFDPAYLTPSFLPPGTAYAGQQKIADLVNAALKHPRLSKCLNEFFGPGTIVTNENLPYVNATQNLSGLGEVRVSEVPATGRGTVYIDRGTFQGLSATDTLLIATYLHETANILAIQRFTHWPDRNTRALLGPRGGPPTESQRRSFDKEIGQQFEECLYRKD